LIAKNPTKNPRTSVQNELHIWEVHVQSMKREVRGEEGEEIGKEGGFTNEGRERLKNIRPLEGRERNMAWGCVGGGVQGE